MDARPDEARDIGGSPIRRQPRESIATISNVIAVGLERYLKEIGLDSASIFRAAGLKPEIFSDKYSQFPIEQMAVALKISARLVDDPYFGLHFGEWYEPPFLYPCNYAVSSAPDLRNALTALQDHRNLVAQMPTQFSENSAFAQMSWVINLVSAPPRQILDFKAMRTLKHIQYATGPNWRPLRVNLAYEEPENVDEHFRLLGPNVHFDQPVNSFWITSSDLRIPMPDADPDLYHMACSSLKNPFACEQNDNNPVERLRQFISAQLSNNRITLAAASKYMDMTPQKLRRLLNKHDTCFQCILDDTRKAHAVHYLCETRIRFSEISYQLGFSDQSVFTRAVKRWFETTPKEMRRSCT
jgi:AraC-like DNA-binding protein